MEAFRDKIYKFYKNFIYAFQNIPRTGWTQYWGVSKSEQESVSEHIASVAMLALFLNTEYKLGLNMEKVLKLALAHELDELIVGDVPLRDKKAVQEKQTKKQEILEKLAEELSVFESGEELLALFKEVEDLSSKEAKFVKEIDYLAFVLQAMSYCEDGIGNKDICNGKVVAKYTHPETKPLKEFINKLKNE